MLARAPHRYPISTLDTDEHDVWLTVGEDEVVGRLRLTNTGKARYRMRVSRSAFEDIPREALVALWRPYDVAAWPFDLPEPATLTRDVERAVNRTEPRAGEDLQVAGGIPRHVYLGRPGERPQSQDEVEQRLIRCIRTRNVMEREILVTETLWPRQCIDEIKTRQKMLESQVSRFKDKDPVMFGWRPEDYDQYFVDRSALNARPVRFEPTPRDVSDFEANIDRDWLRLIPAYDRWIFHARAKLPPLEWWQIADEERVEEHVVIERYQESLKKIFGRVKG